MLLDAVVIMLRETLEAGVLISLLLTISKRSSIKFYWLSYSILIGAIGATLYATNLNTISNWFDYVGLEVINAILQYLIYFSLFFIILLFTKSHTNQNLLKLLFSCVVILAISREGSEIIIFFSSYINDESLLAEVLTSGFIGLMTGVSVGVLCFYIITSLNIKFMRYTQLTLLILIAAGMVSQATQLLIQADWLTAALPIWDSNHIISEQSILGQVLYAIFGYEASPTLMEVVFYLGAMAAMLISMLFTTFFYRQKPSQKNSSI